MSKYPVDKLSIRIPLRVSPTLYHLVERQAWRDVVCNAQLIRMAVIEYLQRKGVEIPPAMNCWKELEMRSERIKAEQTRLDVDKMNKITSVADSPFLPLE